MILLIFFIIIFVGLIVLANSIYNNILRDKDLIHDLTLSIFIRMALRVSPGSLINISDSETYIPSKGYMVPTEFAYLYIRENGTMSHSHREFLLSFISDNRDEFWGMVFKTQDGVGIHIYKYERLYDRIPGGTSDIYCLYKDEWISKDNQN